MISCTLSQIPPISFHNNVLTRESNRHPAKLLSYVENSGLVDCAEKNHTDFDLTASEEGQDVSVKVLAGALKGIVARSGMAGLTTVEVVEKLMKAAVDELSSGKTMFGAQFKWVWGRRAE